MKRSRLCMLAAATAILLVLAGCTGPGKDDDDRPVATRNPLTAVRGPVVVAAGDIACQPGSTMTTTKCRHAATAKLAKVQSPRYVFSLGDHQYPRGGLTAFRKAYARTWGQFKSITKPVPGNHEYETHGAAGYYAYFRDQTKAPGYYAFNANGWRVYALNSNCSDIDCAREAAWLSRDMTAKPRRCTAIMLHHPLYSSGKHRDSPQVRRFWRIALKHHAELALAGHDHDYERFRKMNAFGKTTRHGMVSFVVGAGGKSLYRTRGIRAGSVVFDNHRAGVLVLKLGDHRYGWKYKTIDGKTIDSAIRDCR